MEAVLFTTATMLVIAFIWLQWLSSKVLYLENQVAVLRARDRNQGE